MVWYEEEVKILEEKNKENVLSPKTIFYGSSSIRLWETLSEDFKEINAVNLGFGGSTLEACVWYFDRIVGVYNPNRIIIYAGDNDIGDGKKPEEVYIFFKQLVEKVKKKFGHITCYFISIKPSVSRWELIDKIKYTNMLIENEIVNHNQNWHYINIFNKMIDESGYPQKQYFENDGLHLNVQGYQLWKLEVAAALEFSTAILNNDLTV